MACLIVFSCRYLSENAGPRRALNHASGTLKVDFHVQENRAEMAAHSQILWGAVVPKVYDPHRARHLASLGGCCVRASSRVWTRMRLVTGRNTTANTEIMLLLAWTEFVVDNMGIEVLFPFEFSSPEKA